MKEPQRTPNRETCLDDAIRHLESVHRVVMLRKRKAKVIPYPPRPA